MQMRAQVSMEYMLVVGFSLLMIIPVIAIYGQQRDSINYQINTRQAHNIAHKVADAAETVYYLGKPAKTTLKVYMPANIEAVSIGNQTVKFYINVGKEVTEVNAESGVNMTGYITTRRGLHFIEIAADDYAVNITSR